MMPKFNLSVAAVTALSVGMLFAATEMASAQKAKKMTYEQAYAACAKDIQANVPPETTTSAGRYTRGAACMKKYGYRLKK
jgi:hypothetical protein